MGRTIIEGMTRRALFTQAAGVAAATAIVAAAEAQSLEKSAVVYRNHPKGAERCSGCAFWRAEGAEGACSMVLGKVSPDAWCAIWTAPV